VSVQVAFLRGVGHGPDDMLEMPVLGQALAAAGFAGSRTYRESGNVVVVSDQAPGQLARLISAVIEQRFGRDVFVIVRGHQELAEVVARDPFEGTATDPERYHVAFLDSPLDADEAGKLEKLAAGGEKVTVIGRELYAWHPAGFAGSRLIDGIRAVRVPATARDWTTVTGLLKLAHEVDAAERNRDD
jgi:uncharacterized protein (DUF1697 family)